jgi:NADH-quinone oxidoreductase subunit J
MIGFAILALVLVASAIFTITARRPVHSVVGLLTNFIALAIIYLTLQAEFLAVIQIVVYSGAILILFVFVIALLSSGVKPFDVGPDRAKGVLVPAIAFGALILAGVVATIVKYPVAVRPELQLTGSTKPEDQLAFGSVANFGAALFNHNLLPFEITAFILLVAVIGVILIAGDVGPAGVARRRRKRSGEREPILKEAAR